MAGFGALTVNVSEAVFPVPPFVEDTAPLVFAYVPILEDVTLTVRVQLLPAATVAPLKLTLPPLAAAVTVPAVQVVEAPGVAAFCKPDGYVSEKATPVSALFKFGLVMVKVSVEVPLVRIGLGANNFERLGGVKTVRDALAIPVVPVFVPPSVDEANPLTLS